MSFIRGAIRQPVTVVVGVVLVFLSGIVALRRIPIQLTPNVEDTIIAVTTRWEGASPDEIEQEIVDEQEERLQGIASLREMTSQSLQGIGRIRLEFAVGSDKDAALREVSDKLREVPEYPENADEPVVEASDPENRDYIAWIVLETTDPDLDIRDLQDFAEDRIKPVLERVEGMAELTVLGGREREVLVEFDPVLLAQRGIGVSQLVDALRRSNRNVSGGEVPEGKSNVRLRLVNQFDEIGTVERTVVTETANGPVRVEDVATVFEDFKEPTTFVHSSGDPVIAINAQKEVGENVIEVMNGLKAALAGLNEPGGVLATEARRRNLDGTLELRQVYDQTIYIDDALALVQNNIWLGGALAMVVLMLFLRSIRSAGIVALAIPISIVGAVSGMVAMGRTVNVISLAGMAFAVGMVVDNAIVVLENIFRHLEMGKRPFQAAYDGAREVFGAVLAATLTTVVVFIPILMIEDDAGQLFRDIALAIVVAVTLSLIVSLTVIPVASARILKAVERKDAAGAERRSRLLAPIRALGRAFGGLPDRIGDLTYRIAGSVWARVALIVVLTVASLAGTYGLLPPSDYLPTGNRNLVFGLLIPPPGYNVEQQETLAGRIEETMRPFWEAGEHEPGTPEYEEAREELPRIPTLDRATGQPGEPVQPPPFENYFIVSLEGSMFHGGISSEPSKVVDYLSLFRHATRPEKVPGVLAFAFQLPLFRLGGSTGSAVKINLAGDDLDQVTSAALSVYMQMIQRYGVFTVQPDPSNFNVPGPELQVVPDPVRLSEVGSSPEALGLAVQALGDGAILGDYRIGGQHVDLQVLSTSSREPRAAISISEAPIATPAGGVVPLGRLAELRYVNAPPQINRDNRQRAVTLEFTPPPGVPLEESISEIDALLEEQRQSGAIPATVRTSYSGSASKLAALQEAMFGDGTLPGLMGSAMFLAILVVYLLMCVLFQSFLRPLIVMFSVPLATLGGFAALFGVFLWSVSDPYMPVQNLDVLTLLGFVILIGIVVNNAILIVHQARNFMLGDDSEGYASDPLPPRRAIAEAVRSRVRPIFMGTLTSIGGMAPLVFMPGSGSELYRGLGSVVIGGLLVSTVFTLFLVPSLLSLVTEAQERLGLLQETRDRDSRTSRPSAATAGAGAVLLLFLGSGLSGCRAPEPRASRTDELVRALVAAQLAELAPVDAPAVRPEFPPSRVDAVLEDRMPELHAAGGPEAWAAIELELPDPLAPVEDPTRAVDLDWAVRSATEHNLGVRLSKVRSDVDREGIVVAEAEFDPTLFADVLVDETDEPTTVPVLNGIALGAGENVNDSQSFELGVRKRLTSGGTLTASTFLERFDNRIDGIAFSPDPAWRSGLSLRLEQPLLRGAGADVTLADLALRRNQYQRSQHLLQEDLLVVMSSAEQAFWDLQEAWNLLAIQQLLTQRGADVERVLSERRAFDATPAQYSDALATLERRRGDLIRMQRMVYLASERLKMIVNDPEVSLASEELLRPAGGLSAEAFSFQLHRVVATALLERPELRRALLAIDDSDLRLQVAENLRRPLVDLRAGVAVSGLDDGAGSSYESLFGDDFVGAFVGLAFELPAGNRSAAARVRQRMHENRAALVEYERALRGVILEVKEALRDVQTSYALVGAARTFRIAQTENLRALEAEEESRSNLTPEFLNLKFQRQERLAEAQAREVSALAEYNRAVAELHRAIGTGFRSDRVDLR